MINNFTTLGMPIISTSRVIKIESKQIKSQKVPCFFISSTTKDNTTKVKKNINEKKCIVKK